MDLNEFIIINKKTKLDDLDIMINELDVLIFLYQKTYSLKRLGVKNGQYKKELLDFVQADSRRINLDEFFMENNKISLVAYNANKAFLQNSELERKLFTILFFSNKTYWNKEKQDLAKEKIEMINARLSSLDRIRMALFFA
jgi:hypothetical protein